MTAPSPDPGGQGEGLSANPLDSRLVVSALASTPHPQVGTSATSLTDLSPVTQETPSSSSSGAEMGGLHRQL